jgi:uncharacterized protein (UPF0335 family)
MNATTMRLGDGLEIPFDADQLKGHIAIALGRNSKAHMKPDVDFAKMADHAYSVTAEELRQFIEQFEQLEAEKKDLATQQKEVMAEAKGRGYDTKALRKIVALRKKNPDELAEEEAVLDVYKQALGMA